MGRYTAALAAFVLAIVAMMPLVANANSSFSLASTTTLQLGYTLTHMNYAEQPSKPYLDTEMGDLHGATLTFNRFTPATFTHTSLAYVEGNTHYNGSIQTPTGDIPYRGSTANKILTYQADAGPAFAIGQRDLIAPFIGTSVYYWRRDVGNGAPGGSTEKYVHWTVNAGLADRFAITSRFAVQLRGEATYAIANGIETPEGDAFLGHDWGYSGAVSLDYRVLKPLEVYVRAGVQRFRFQRGDLGAGVYEPNSRTLNASYSAGLGYRF